MSHHYEPSKLEEHASAHAGKGRGRPLHRTWWFWLAIALMLAAMLLYGLASEASLVPAGPPASHVAPATTPAPTQR